ncbi:MAG: DNA polymerase III subunit delta [Burkholderiaceae bacterium]|nr:DNA polymerase III subunit delta [Burkholderiaceae bacterium]
MTQLRADGLAGALARRVPPIVWIHGDEALIVQECAQSVRDALRARGFDERQVFEAGRGFQVEALTAQADALSLFAGRRLIELRFGSGRPTKEIGKALAEAAARLDDDTRLLVSGPRLDRASAASEWFAAIDRAGYVVAVWPIERAQLPQWIATRLGRQKQRADRDTLEWIAERVEGNLLAAHQEIAKLGLLCPAGELSREAVRDAVLDVARYDAFDLVDAMLGADAARALRTLDGLHAEGVAEPLVLWALADALRTLLRLREACDGGTALAQAMREARVPRPRERGYERALGRLDAAALRAALRRAASVDRMVKGIETGDAWQALESLALHVAGAPVLVGNPDGD